jgi:predicted esterase
MVNYLLLLHGYTQNAVRIEKTFTKLLSKTYLQNYSIICPNGPYIVNNNFDESFRGWWNLPSPEMYSKGYNYNGYMDAVTTVNNSINTINDNDNLSVIGFSQGAVLLEIMLAHNLINKNPNKIILFSSAGISDEKLQLSQKKDTDIPILSFFGEREGIFNITPSLYKKNSSIRSDNHKIVIHDQGHVIPSKSKYKEIIKDFLDL